MPRKNDPDREQRRRDADIRSSHEEMNAEWRFLKPRYLIPGAALLLLVPLFICRTTTITGPPSAFNPISALPEMLELAGDRMVLVPPLKIHGLKVDGTVDLTAADSAHPAVQFTACEELPDTQAPRPIGAPPPTRKLSPADATACRLVGACKPWSFLSTDNEDWPPFCLGLVRSCSRTGRPDGPPQPPPACSLTDLLQQARAAGLPEDARVDLEYNGQDYRIHHPATSFFIQFSTDCRPLDH